LADKESTRAGGLAYCARVVGSGYLLCYFRPPADAVSVQETRS